MVLPNVCCFECDEYGHIVADCLHPVPPSGTPAHHHRLKSHTRHHTRSTSHHHHQDIYRHSRSWSQSHPHRYCSHSWHDSYRGHSRSHHRDSRHHHRILHDAITPVLIVPAVIPHITDCLHTGAHQLILGTRADHDPMQHTNQVRKPCINLQCIPAELKTNCMIKEIQVSQ